MYVYHTEKRLEGYASVWMWLCVRLCVCLWVLLWSSGIRGEVYFLFIDLYVHKEEKLEQVSVEASCP